MELRPTSEEPSAFERLTCELINSQEYVGVSQEEVNFFLGESGWNLVLTKGGKWRIE